MKRPVEGFSKLTKEQKIDWLAKAYFYDDENAVYVLKQYWNEDTQLQKLHDEFIENTISNFYLPFAVAPNFLVNGEYYTIPMTIEESSVVAAASKAAKFWQKRGGFIAKVIDTEKIGQVHFMYSGDKSRLQTFFTYIKPQLIHAVKDITKNMEKRGGGIIDIELRDKTEALTNYYQLHATFNTLDAMGANFINSCLEQFAKTFKAAAQDYSEFTSSEKDYKLS